MSQATVCGPQIHFVDIKSTKSPTHHVWQTVTAKLKRNLPVNTEEGGEVSGWKGK